MKKSKRLSWKPRRRGLIFCSSARGRGYAWGGRKEAKEFGRQLARDLGPEWTFRVWENLGWHWAAISKCGRIKVHEDGNCIAYLGESRVPGGRWVESGRTPQVAVRKVIAAARRDLAWIEALLFTLPEV